MRREMAVDKVHLCVRSPILPRLAGLVTAVGSCISAFGISQSSATTQVGSESIFCWLKTAQLNPKVRFPSPPRNESKGTLKSGLLPAPLVKQVGSSSSPLGARQLLVTVELVSSRPAE